MDTAPRDEDLEQALKENKLVVAKKQQRVKALRNKIADLKMYHPHLKSAATETNPQRRAPPEGFDTGGGGGGAFASGNWSARGAGAGGGPGRDGVGGVGSQGVARPGAVDVVVSTGGVQELTSAMAAGSMALGSPAPGTRALAADVVEKVVCSEGESARQRVGNNAATLPGGAVRGGVEGNTSSSCDSGGGTGGVADGSGGVTL